MSFFMMIDFMPPTLEKLKGHIAFGSSVYASVHPLQNLLRYSFEISYMDSLSKIIDTYFFKSELCPFVELCPFERVIMKFCNQDFSKTITATSFKHGKLIEHNE